MLTVDPEQFAGCGIECDSGTPRARSSVEDSVHHQGRAFELEFGAIADAVGLEAPCDFEFAEVRSVDLIERPIAAASKVCGVAGPLSVFLSAGQQAGE